MGDERDRDDGEPQIPKSLDPGFPRRLGRFGMAFAPFPRKTQRFQLLSAETTEEPNG
jgi:hypothetical protein